MCNHQNEYDQLHQDLRDLRTELKAFAEITLALSELSDRVATLEGRLETQTMANQQFLESVLRNINEKLKRIEEQ